MCSKREIRAMQKRRNRKRVREALSRIAQTKMFFDVVEHRGSRRSRCRLDRREARSEPTLQKLQAEQGGDVVLAGSVARRSPAASGGQQAREPRLKCYAPYPATVVAGLRAAIPSIRRENPVVNRFKPSSAPMAHAEFHGR